MVISILLAASLAATRHVEPPPGWRYPDASELTEDTRRASPTRFATAIADLNGDGTEDTAVLLKSTSRSAEALWVHLSSKDGASAWIKVDEIEWSTPGVALMMGVDLQAPGVIAYACFDNAKECDFGPDQQRPKLRLSSPSLMYFKPGSSASLVFWSNTQEKFLRVWLSD